MHIPKWGVKEQTKRFPTSSGFSGDSSVVSCCLGSIRCGIMIQKTAVDYCNLRIGSGSGLRTNTYNMLKPILFAESYPLLNLDNLAI